MSHVFVVDTNYKPGNPIHPARARYLLKTRQAAVWRRYPFTIILKHALPLEPERLRIKVDPGSRATGIAVVNDTSGTVVFAAELHHRGGLIKQRLDERRAVRRQRRTRKLRHRAPRFANRARKAGWLSPSLTSRVANVITWVGRLRRVAPITAISLEWVKFDTQQLQDAEIAGVEYQQGQLAGYEVREYLLEKWHRQCAYCGRQHIPLEIEHIVPKSRGGTDRVSNLTLACHDCNQRKSNRTAAEFGYPQVQQQAKQPLPDAAAMNSTRKALWRGLCAAGLPVETGSGGLTKFNRIQRNLPKTHWRDAACVGRSTPAVLHTQGVRVLTIRAMGYGTRQMCRRDKYGFPRQHRTRRNTHFGFHTGDVGRAVITAGKHRGTHVGRIAVRASGKFRVGNVDGISYRYIHLIWRADGYAYQHA